MRACISLLTIACAFPLVAEVRLPAIFSDHMVLQREVEVPVWGWGGPGEKVNVSFAGQAKSTVADEDGKWSVKQPRQEVSATPRELNVKGNNEIKNCGIVPIHDTLHGNINDIHPWDKKPVAERPASLALKKDYGRNVAWTGPEFASAKASGGKIIVSFDGIDNGLATTDGQEPACFEIAREDKFFVPAKASIQGDTVVVGTEGVASPKHVKMGWNEIQVPNLADRNGWQVFRFSAMGAKQERQAGSAGTASWS